MEVFEEPEDEVEVVATEVAGVKTEETRLKTKAFKRTQEVKDTLLTPLGTAVRLIGFTMTPLGSAKLQQPVQ